ncbi:MAG: helix-turn-helix domain-containing protein [Desulfuromonadales bacterium]
MKVSSDYLVSRIGRFVRQERLRRGESQRVFAVRIGIHPSTLSRLEQGKGGTLGLQYLMQILKVLDVESRLYELIRPTVETSDTENAWN